MQLSTVRRRMARLEALADSYCPECADWPAEIALRIVEVIVEPGQPLEPPDPAARRPTEFGPCPCCGRVHRARVVELVKED
jgi:hypothetical protein